MKWYVKAFFVSVIIGLPLSGYAGWFGPSDFDECMVEEMKGQPSNAYAHVYTLCRKRFPLEEPEKKKVAIKAGQLEYSWHLGQTMATLFAPARPYVAIEFTRTPAGAKIAEISARFSEKDCTNSVNGDFRYSVSFQHFLGNRASTYYESDKALKCMRLEEMYVFE